MLCAAVCNWNVVASNPFLSKEITYIDVPRDPSSKILPVFNLYCAMIILEQYDMLNIISLRYHEQTNIDVVWWVITHATTLASVEIFFRFLLAGLALYHPISK